MCLHRLSHALLLLLALTQAAFAGQLHVFTSDAAGFNTHSVWYDDGHEVTVVDTQFTPSQANALLVDIRRQTSSPVTRVIVTHPNPDKFNALSIFHAIGAESYASKRTAAAMPGVDAYKRYYWINIAKAFTEATYPSVEPVKTTFSGRLQIRLKSGETITLIELEKPGVSSCQTVVRFDQTGDLAVGDLVHTRNHAWLEGGIVDGKPKFTRAGWKADLQELAGLTTQPQAKVYGGRGVFVAARQAVAEETTYLDRVDAIVAKYIDSLGARTSELSDPTKQQAHFQDIQAQVAKAFPDYAMPELIGYSVYGLVQSKLRRKEK